MKPTYPLVQITWNDAYSPSAGDVINTDNIKELHTTMLINTVGWELRNDEAGVTLAAESCGDGDYRGGTFIPKAMVESRQVLRVVRPRKPPPLKAGA